MESDAANRRKPNVRPANLTNRTVFLRWHALSTLRLGACYQELDNAGRYSAAFGPQTIRNAPCVGQQAGSR